MYTYRQVLACTEWQVGSSVWPPCTAPGLAAEYPWKEGKSKELAFRNASVQTIIP